MGNISLTVASLSTEKTFNDTTAANVLDNFVAAYNGPIDGTNQEKLDWVLDKIVDYVTDVHLGYVRKQAAQQAGQDAIDTADRLE